MRMCTAHLVPTVCQGLATATHTLLQMLRGWLPKWLLDQSTPKEEMSVQEAEELRGRCVQGTGHAGGMFDSELGREEDWRHLGYNEGEQEGARYGSGGAQELGA